MIKQMLLTEKASASVLSNADLLASLISDKMGLDEMRANRGKNFTLTNFYQLRFKPKSKDDDLNLILMQINKLLISAEGRKLGISSVQINPISKNSSKYSSVSFDVDGQDFDIVIAKGANNGENFEKELLLKLDNVVAGIDSSEEAIAAIDALEQIDPEFNLNNISAVKARKGSTKRSSDLSSDEIGKIIADIVIELKKGGERYISLKSSNGNTVAQFGISKAFTDDLSVVTSSSEWVEWVKPFGLDPKKIESGLKEYRDGVETDKDDIIKSDEVLSTKSAVYKIIRKMWGSGYYYLRHTGKSFKAIKIDDAYLDNVVLKGLKMTEIRYPSIDRKSIVILLESHGMKMKVEFRNPRGMGSIKPTQIQLIVTKTLNK